MFDAHVSYSGSLDGLEAYLAACERANGVGAVVLCVKRGGPAVLAQLERGRPGFFVPFEHFDLDSGPLDELVRAAGEGYRGIYVPSPLEPYHHERYLPVYAKAEELSLAVVAECGRRWSARPIFLDEVCCRFSELKTIGTCFGYPWYAEACAAYRQPRLHFDLAPHQLACWDADGKLRVKPIFHDLNWLYADDIEQPELRPDKLLFGSGIDLGERDAGDVLQRRLQINMECFRTLGWTGEQVDAVLGGSARSLLVT